MNIQFVDNKRPDHRLVFLNTQDLMFDCTDDMSKILIHKNGTLFASIPMRMSQFMHQLNAQLSNGASVVTIYHD